MFNVIFHKKIILSEQGWFPQIELESVKMLPFTPMAGLALNDRGEWKFVIKDVGWDIEKQCFHAYSEPLRLSKEGWEHKRESYARAGWKIIRRGAK